MKGPGFFCPIAPWPHSLGFAASLGPVEGGRGLEDAWPSEASLRNTSAISVRPSAMCRRCKLGRVGRVDVGHGIQNDVNMSDIFN